LSRLIFHFTHAVLFLAGGVWDRRRFGRWTHSRGDQKVLFGSRVIVPLLTIFLYSCFCFSLALLACHSTRGEWGRPPFPLPSPPFEHVSAGTARGLPSLSSIYKETSLVRCCHQWFSIYHVRAKEQFLSSQMHGLIFSFSFSKL
jgi:hypothetical protein